jgi:tetratricopeptide (TPR) repeat protein
MNSFSNYQIPPLAKWAVFEDLCLSIWKRIWNDDTAQKYGRKGQKQNGVDLFGRPNKGNEYVGVQCKCKENMLGAKLTIPEIKKEINLAIKFKPELKEYIIATTSVRDVNIQKYCMEVTLEHKKINKFSVGVLFWEDIKELITEEEIVRFYPSFVIPEKPLQLEESIREEKKSTRIFEEKTQKEENIIFDLSKLISEIKEEEYNAELNSVKSLLNSFEVDKALFNLEALKNRIWNNSSDQIKFRILTNIGSANLYKNKHQEAAKHFIEAYQFNKDEEKAISNLSLAYFILKEFVKSKDFALKVLKINPSNYMAFSMLIQSQIHLGEKNIEEVVKTIPSEVRTSSEVYSMLSYQAYKQNDVKSAKKYGEIALNLDEKNNPEIKTNLAIILLETLFKQQNIVFGAQISSETKKQFVKIINLFSEAWEKIKGKDLAKYRSFWLTNRAKAYRLLNNLNDAERDIDLALHYEPDNPEYIFEKAIISFENNNIDYFFINRKKIEKIFDVIPQSVLLFAEVISLKDIEESINILSKYLDGKDLNIILNKEALRSLINLLLKNEDYKEAKTYIDKLILVNNLDGIDKTILSKFYRLSGNDIKAIEYIKDAINLLKNKTATYREKLEISNELFYRKNYPEAQKIFKNILDVSLNNELTHKIIYCYYKNGDHERALEICESLTNKHGALEFVSEIQSEIYEEIDRPDKALETYKNYIAKFPHDLNIKIKKARIDYILKNIPAVKKLLEEIDIINNFSLQQNVYISNLCIRTGMYEKALYLLYESRRKYYNQSNAHLQYIGLFLVKGKCLKDIFQNLKNDCVGENIAVLIESVQENMEPKWYIIENRQKIDRKFGELNLEESFAKKMIGKKTGDTFDIKKNDILTKKYKIVKIENKYIRAYDESISEFENMFPEAKGLFRINIGTPKTKKAFDSGIQKILEINEAYKNQVEEIEKLYKNKRISLGCFAKLIGRDIYDVWSVLSNKKYLGIACCSGTSKEQKNALNILNGNINLVIDITSLFTIEILDLKETIAANYANKLIVSKSTFALIENIINEKKELYSEGYMILSKENDKYVKHEVTKKDIKKQIYFLERMLTWISENFKIVPCTETLKININKKRKLDETIGKSFIDTILIAKKDNYILFSDDLVLRLIAKNDFNVDGVWTQILLLNLLNSGKIKKEIYIDKTINLIEYNYSYIIFDAEILAESLKRAYFEHDINPYTDVLERLNTTDEISIINLTIDYMEILNTKTNISSVRKNFLIVNYLDKISDKGCNKKIIKNLKFIIKKRYRLLPIIQNKIISFIEDWKKTKIIL